MKESCWQVFVLFQVSFEVESETKDDLLSFFVLLSGVLARFSAYFSLVRLSAQLYFSEVMSAEYTVWGVLKDFE